MHIRRHHFIDLTTIMLFLLSCLLSPSLGRADVLDSARMLPGDTMVMVSIESSNALKTALKKTSWYDLYQDPAMQDVTHQVEEKLREGAGNLLKDFWKKMEIDTPPEKLPWPQGKIVMGISVLPKEAEASAETSEEDFDEDPLVFVAILADVGSQAAETRDVLRSLSAGAKGQGDTVERKTIAGIDMDIRPAENDSDPTVCYGIKDNWLLVTLAEPSISLNGTESVAKRIGRTLDGSLAENKGFAPARRTVGEGEVFVYCNAEAIRSLVAEMVGNKPQVEHIARSLGLDNVTSVAMSLKIAGDRSQNLGAKTLIGIDGPKRGIPALLSAPAASLKLDDHLMTRDLIGFLWTNYEPARLYDGIAKMVGEAVYMDLNMLVQAGMMGTAKEAGQQPVQLRDDVIAQAQAPLFFTSKIEKPYSLTSPTKFLVGLSVQDENRLDVALGRIHQAFVGGAPELRRELLDHTVYLFPAFDEPMEPTDPTSSQVPPEVEQMAFAVTGENLVFGQVGEVEQAIRGLAAEPSNTIASDPMFRHARKFLPSQASLYSYRNDRLYAEVGWTILKQIVRDLPDESEVEPDFVFDLGGQIKGWLKAASEHVDLSKLPEFSAIEKYWGASMSFAQDRPEGIYGESIVLKPAQQ